MTETNHETHSACNERITGGNAKCCPFCGSNARLDNLVSEVAITCPDCRATIVRRHDARKDEVAIRKATKAWNTRTPDLGKVLDDLIRAVQSYGTVRTHPNGDVVQSQDRELHRALAAAKEARGK